ncbi:MAG: hypothetical protein AAF598_10455, partial [Bacteroidota bacterium]
MYQKVALVMAFSMIWIGARAQSNSNALQEAEQIIQSYVDDYRTDRFAADSTFFGIEVLDIGWWTVHVTGQQINEIWEVQL